MKINIYAKIQEQLDLFDEVLSKLMIDGDELYISTENRRSFRFFDKIANKDNSDDIYVVSSLKTLGLNEKDIMDKLLWFIENAVVLVIASIPSTYEAGIAQPLNQTILKTISQFVSNGNKNIVSISSKRCNSGRNKLPFPDNWDELYEKWEKQEISSQEFIKLAKLKKATFYNFLKEYKDIQAYNREYLKKHEVI